jgi:hypothetical protein
MSPVFKQISKVRSPSLAAIKRAHMSKTNAPTGSSPKTRVNLQTKCVRGQTSEVKKSEGEAITFVTGTTHNYHNSARSCRGNPCEENAKKMTITAHDKLSNIRGLDKSKLFDATKSQEAKCFFSGVYLGRDLPNGINDTALRLFRTASLKCFKPPFVPNEMDAFEHYLLIPDGLEKAQFERQAWKSVEPHVAELKDKFGIAFIHQLLPATKLVSLFQNLNSRPSNYLTTECLDIIQMLTVDEQSKRKKTSIGKSLMKDECQHFLKARGTKEENVSDENEVIPSSLFHMHSKCAADQDRRQLNGSLWSTYDTAGRHRCQPPETSTSNNEQDATNGHRSWVLPYSQRVIKNANQMFPGYQKYKEAESQRNGGGQRDWVS